MTVCPEKNKPPDNWAALEIILNLVAFECGKEYDTLNPKPPCNVTQNVRNDFEYFLEDTMKAVVERNDFSNHSKNLDVFLIFMVYDEFLMSNVIPHLASFLDTTAEDNQHVRNFIA